MHDLTFTLASWHFNETRIYYDSVVIRQTPCVKKLSMYSNLYLNLHSSIAVWIMEYIVRYAVVICIAVKTSIRRVASSSNLACDCCHFEVDSVSERW